MLQCECGRAISLFEKERFGRCGFCHEQKSKNMRLRLAVQEWERKEKERWEKERQEEERQRRIQELRAEKMKLLEKLQGKTICSIEVTSWERIVNDEWWEPGQIVLKMTDGTGVTFTEDYHSDGCMGYYDDYHYLGIEIEEETES
ncbi:hypothetical protein [Paenibacillus thiaminolyticus]|uniref:Uncharacterized protein n=1 Tax=Paenibacillus thiaminolyticus TaxID=49283 RepID=A0A3A3GN87_PANTH|nr:hypothetical protein [Paenibacillus thiaminolyticus]RJG26684.1 hypothetical protein DQX05_01235 [Paenibacillus thiaminolyticus]